MRVKSNRFLNEILTEKIVNMIKEKVVYNAIFLEIELSENGFATVIVQIENEKYKLTYEYNINNVDFVKVEKLK